MQLLLCSLVLSVAIHADLSVAAYNYCEADKPSVDRYATVDNAQLLHITAITRHGDRTPTIPLADSDDVEYRCDDSAETFASEASAPMEQFIVNGQSPLRQRLWKGSCAVGQLTPKGAKQHVALGGALRDLYVDHLKFLPAELSSLETLHVRATDVWRTKQSASALLSGLYHGAARVNATRVIPLHVYPAELETMNSSKLSCARVDTLNAAMYKEKAYLTYFSQQQALIQKMDRVLGTSENAVFHKNSMFPFLDTLMPRQCHGMSLPCRDGECITEQDVAQVMDAVNQEYTLLRRDLPQSADVNRLKSGLFLGEIQQDLLMLAQGKREQEKLRLYSAHDSTVHGLLGNLMSKDVTWPPYASQFLIELWEKKTTATPLRVQTEPQRQETALSNFLIRILYNGQWLVTDWCDFATGCPLSTFMQYIDTRIPKDFSAECSSK